MEKSSQKSTPTTSNHVVKDSSSSKNQETPQLYFQQHHEIYCGLVRLQESLTQPIITTTTTTTTATATATEPREGAEQIELGHWRELNPDIQKAYQLIEEGAEYIKVTSTKYALMGKVSSSSKSHIDLANELLRGAEQIATGASFLLQNGCGRSCQKAIREGVRNTISALASLLQVFLHKKEKGDEEEIFHATANRKTGVVWSTCDELRLLPKGNRSAIRRELLGWIRDCTETIQEFQLLLEKHPPQSTNTNDDININGTKNKMQQLSLGNNDSNDLEEGEKEEWDAFCTGEDEDLFYTESERRIVESCLALIKCSRGTLKLTLESCEVAGEILTAAAADIDTDSTEEKQILRWIGKFSDAAKEVGEGVTNLGMQLYPTLQLEALSSELTAQKQALVHLQRCITNAADDNTSMASSSLSELKVKADKLTHNAEEHYRQANDAILLVPLG